MLVWLKKKVGSLRMTKNQQEKEGRKMLQMQTQAQSTAAEHVKGPECGLVFKRGM
jgi:hypothetical protein